MESLTDFDRLTRQQLIQLGQSWQSQIQDQQSQIQDQQSQIQSLQSANQSLEFKLAELTHQLTGLRKLVYGSKSERFVPANPDSPVQQGALDLVVDVLGDRTITTRPLSYTRTEVTTKPHIHPGRNPLPVDLPREQIVIEPKEDTTGAVKIGEEVSEVLEIQEQKLFVKRYVRPKYLLKTAEQTLFLIAPLPVQPIAKCIAGPGLLAQVVIDKYVDACVP